MSKVMLMELRTPAMAQGTTQLIVYIDEINE